MCILCVGITLPNFSCSPVTFQPTTFPKEKTASDCSSNPCHLSNPKFPLSFVYVEAWPFWCCYINVFPEGSPKTGMQPWVLMPDHKGMFLLFLLCFIWLKEWSREAFPWIHLKACHMGFDQSALKYSLSKHSHILQSSAWALSWAKLFVRLYKPVVNFFHFRHGSPE